MSLLVSSKMFKDSKSLNRIFLDKDFIQCGNYFYYLLGEIFVDQHLLAQYIEGEKLELIPSLLGDYSIVLVKRSGDEINLISDKAGRNILFYGQDESLCVSTDFWSIVDSLNKTLNDINVQALKEQMVFNTTLDHNTIVNGIKMMAPSTILTLNDQGRQVKINKYWNFKLNCSKENISKEEKIERFDFELTNAFKLIKNNNPSDTVYNIGVSGGMDSRIIPFYAQKENLKLESFIIGDSHPKGLLLSGDHISSRKIVDYFDLKNHQEIAYNTLSLDKKLEKDAMAFPYGGSQLFITIPDNMVTGDVLLTGASGFYIGASPIYRDVVSNDIKYSTLKYLSLLKKVNKKQKWEKAYIFLTNKPKARKVEFFSEGIAGLIERTEVDNSINKIQSFYAELEGFSNIEKIMNFNVSGIGHKNKLGSFESLLGQKKSYTIYSPFLSDFIQTWNDEDLIGRQLFHDFILEKHLEISKIKGQDYKVALSRQENANVLSKLTAMTEFYLRGKGVMNYENWLRDVTFQRFINTEIFNQDTYIHSFVDRKIIKDLYNEGEVHNKVFENILKLNKVLEIIDKKLYKQI